MQRSHQPIGTHDDGTLWELIVVLLDTLQIISRRVGLANSPRGQIHDLVPVPADIGVKLRHTEMCPVSSNHGEDMAEGIRPRRRSHERSGKSKEDLMKRV